MLVIEGHGGRGWEGEQVHNMIKEERWWWTESAQVCTHTHRHTQANTHDTNLSFHVRYKEKREETTKHLLFPLLPLLLPRYTHTHTLRNFSFMSFVPKGDITLFEKCDTESYKELTNTHRHTRCLRLSRTFCPMNRWSEAGHTHTHTQRHAESE